MTNPDAVTIPHFTRPQLIAAVHAAAGFLADSPDLPFPTDVQMIAHNVPDDVFDRVADTHGAEISFGGTTTWATIPVAYEPLHGVRIEYTMFRNTQRRCSATLDGNRCVQPEGHIRGTMATGHFYDDDKRTDEDDQP